MLKNIMLSTMFTLPVALSAKSRDTDKPNLLLIMCDDMGFSDLGSYGGEIKTPNIDKLADNGLRFSHFRNTSRCCPSRASLLTGHHQHNVDMGWMSAVDEHRPGFRGQISDKIPTLAEVLKREGYQNYMSGKWHLTIDKNWETPSEAPNGSWPTQRGFHQFYGGMSGGGSFWKPKSIARNLTRIPKDQLEKNYYYTHAITKNAVQFINQHDSKKPMFMYLAHYAPHRPLEAPEHRIQKCMKRYEVGYDVLRQQRFERQKKLGFYPKDAVLPVHQQEYGGNYPSWEKLGSHRQKQWIREMATYAAMIEIMDDGIGEVLTTLKNKKMLDDTVVVFLSDNGATSEGSFISQLAAQLSNTPYRSYKRWVYEGGVNSPLIVHWPKALAKKSRGKIVRERAHITDIMPTCLNLLSVKAPRKFKGEKLKRFAGRSLVPSLKGKKLSSRTHFFEHQSSCAIIEDDWKLVRYSKARPWELYQLSSDPFETKSLASSNEEKFAELKNKWQKWAENNKVLPLVDMGWSQRIKHFVDLNPDQDGVDDTSK